MEEILGVVNEVPVPREDPPVEAAYQLIVPELAVAPNVTVPVPHLLFGLVVTDGNDPTLAKTEVLVVVQLLSVASIQ